MRTETINNIEYEIGKLGAFEQLHVGRKLAPLLAHAIPALMQISDQGEKANFEMVLFSAAAIPLADVLCKMAKEDVDYVVTECCSVCQRKQAKNWAKVMANGTLMFQDIEADTLIRLTQAVVEVSLGRFFLYKPVRFEHAGIPGFVPVGMSTGEDWLLRPVLRGLCRYESLIDGTVDLYDIARLNELLDVHDENERRMTLAIRQNQEK